jgi:hypothetical protein
MPIVGNGDTVSALETVGVDTGMGPILALREPQRFVVEIQYTDGAVDEFFPFNLLRQSFLMENHSLGLYLVTPNPSRRIARLRLRDRMSNGAFFLFAATWNSKRPLFPNIAWSGMSLPSVGTPRNPTAAPAQARREGERLILENTYYRFEFSAEQNLRLREAWDKYAGAQLLAGPQGENLFSCELSGFAHGLPVTRKVQMDDFQISQLALNEHRVDLWLASRDPTFPLSVRFELTVDDTPGLEAALTMENTGAAPLSVDLTFPQLSDLHLGRAEDTYYLFPRGAAILSNADQDLEAAYDDNLPLQFMDIFNPLMNDGFGVLVKDTESLPKVFRLSKRQDQTGLAVSYSYPVSGPSAYRQAIRLEPQEKFQTPRVALLVHGGDWRPAFRTYRDWVRTWYNPLPLKNWFRQVFNMRRDYPLGGTGKLFDLATNQYTLDQLIHEGREFGGIDMIDISGWAYSPRYGRVGDYNHFALGGLENFKQSIARAQSEEVAVGLYTEGYLVDLNSQVGEQYARAWQIIDRLGVPQAWPGADSEVFECPYAKGWQEYMAATAGRVLRETGAKAF